MSLRIRETNIFEESYRDITLIKSKNERITSEPTAKIKKKTNCFVQWEQILMILEFTWICCKNIDGKFLSLSDLTAMANAMAIAIYRT